MLRYLPLYLFLAVAGCLLFPAFALGAVDPPPSPTLALPTDQLWAFAAGNLAILVAYILNHAGPWLSEEAKGIVAVITTAIAGAITQAITAGDVGFNGTTLQFAVTAVVGGLMAHKWFWQPSNIGARFGAGSNAS